MRGFQAIGQVYTPETLAEHVLGVDLSRWQGVCVHHTALPDLSMRPRGFTVQHMENIKWGYTEGRRRRGLRPWSAGPHLFVDEDQAFGMTPLDERGIHAVSFNDTHLGVELLGNYDRKEEAESDRAARVFETGARVVAALLRHTGGSNLKWHSDDPKTSKSCPGTFFPAGRFRRRVGQLLEEREAPEGAQPVSSRELRDTIRERIESIEWQLKKMRELLRKHS